MSATYAAVGLVAAVSVFALGLVAATRADDGADAAVFVALSLVTAVVAGALWPLTLIVAASWVAVMAARRWLARRGEDAR